MKLTASQKRLIERIVNVFETGSVNGNYAAIAIFNDGPNNIKQITYGRSQTTEYGNLRELVQNYAGAGGTYSKKLKPYVEKIGKSALTDNEDFKDLLKKAGKEDPPKSGGNEIEWTTAYVTSRHRWLAEHPREAVRRTTYRTQCFINEIAKGNWTLGMVPINANGTKVSS